MSELTTQSIVSSDNYMEIKNMLISNDDGSRNVALNILEQSDFEKSKLYVLCILKESYDKIGQDFKSESYRTLFDNVKETLKDSATDISSLTFRKIYEIAVERDNKDEIAFMLSIFKDELLGLLKDYGFSFLEYLDIEIKPKKIEAND